MQERHREVAMESPPQGQAPQDEPAGGLEREVEALRDELEGIYQQAADLQDDVMRTTPRVGDGQ
jgi:hypothetical protein